MRTSLYAPLFNRLEELSSRGERVILAIDGRCGAGKTTLAGILKERYDCLVLPIDDFFLRPEQRTAARLAEPGGNIDYERFRSEVLEPLKTGEPFSYRPYDCHAQKLAEPVLVEPTLLTVVEGSYSLHPYFDGFYTLSVFLTLPVPAQLERLRARNPANLDRFVSEWIPMEERYFEGFKVSEKSSFCFDTGARQIEN
ncbi:MAG: uridine kinase [Oscillospiraceae bacterium]|jgi:uridine kinase|nr:uridine kinase [Oscillospiraceae bacterium]